MFAIMSDKQIIFRRVFPAHIYLYELNVFLEEKICFQCNTYLQLDQMC